MLMSTIDALDNNVQSFETYTHHILTTLIDYSPKLISALLLLFIGLWVVKFVGKVIRKIMVRRQVEPTLVEFLSDIIYWGLRIVLFIAVISKLGIESSSFVAILGAAGLAVGLSLQGSLSNFAGGMLIILFKPFKLGDAIEAQGVSGTVIDIQIFVTQLLTANNQVIFVPNGALSNGTIINFSQQHERRVDLNVGISYDTDIQLVRETALAVMKANDKILQTPEPAVSIRELTDSGIRLAIRGWTKNADHADASSEVLEQILESFAQKSIAIQPYLKELTKG